jgi:diguanylate cyclase (GGDEF)-like protein
MPEEIMLYILLIGLAGVLSLGLCFFSFIQLKEAPGGRQYTLATLFSAVFSFAYILELMSSNLKEAKFWLGLEYLVMPFIPAFLLWMCAEYSGIRIRQRYLYLLFFTPILTVFTHHTNGLHHLYYTSVGLKEGLPFPILDLEYGPFFYVHSLYLFICLSISIAILLMQLTSSLFRFKMQIIMMVTGLFVPIVANHFYLNDLSPYGIDLGPVSMSVSFILHGLALFTYKMFNVLPIAREKVFDSMREGVIVLDQNGALVDYNQSMLAVTPELNALAIGKPINTVLSQNRKLAERICQGEECDYKSEWEGEISHFQIRFSPVYRKNITLIGTIITFTNITERVILQEKLKRLARYDGLTGVYNRTYFLEKAQKLLELNGENASIILFDIDHFKKVNDTYGHETGDRVLTEVARIASECLGKDDVIGRYGGEEFVIFLSEASAADAYVTADIIRSRIAENLIENDRHFVKVSSSFGVSAIIQSTETENQRIKQAMGKADLALYEAKRNGRNKVQIFHENKPLTSEVSV